MFFFSVVIHNINKLHTQEKKNKHVHREITLENKTRLNKNNYVTKTMKNKQLKNDILRTRSFVVLVHQ